MTTFNQLFDILLDAVIALVLLAFSTIVMPWFKSAVIPWLKEKHLYGVVKRFVNAAEKLADSGKLQKSEKKDYVLRLLASKGVAVTEEIDAMIESAVIELDIAFSEIIYEFEEVFEEDECDPEAENECEAEADPAV